MAGEGILTTLETKLRERRGSCPDPFICLTRSAKLQQLQLGTDIQEGNDGERAAAAVASCTSRRSRFSRQGGGGKGRRGEENRGRVEWAHLFQKSQPQGHREQPLLLNYNVLKQ